MTIKVFEPFTRLDAADLNNNNTFLQEQDELAISQSVQPFADGTARDAAIGTAVDGQVTTLATDKNLQTYYGQWRPLPFAIETGVVSITPVANTSTGVAVTWEVGRFTDAPIVMTNALTTTAVVRETSFNNPTTSGATIRVVRENTTVTTVNYLAIQMTNGSGVG